MVTKDGGLDVDTGGGILQDEVWGDMNFEKKAKLFFNAGGKALKGGI